MAQILTINNLDAVRYSPENVNWVIDQIAIAGYSPVKNSTWAGKEDLVRRAAEKFRIKAADSRGLVERATEILWDQAHDQMPDVARRIAIRRLQLLIQQLTEALLTPSEKRIYDVKAAVGKNNETLVHADGRLKRRRVLREVQIEKKLNPSLANVLLDYQKELNALMGVQQKKDEQTAKAMVTDMLEKAKKMLDAKHDGIKRGKPGSLVQNNTTINNNLNLGPDGIAEIERTIQEQSVRTAKREQTTFKILPQIKAL